MSRTYGEYLRLEELLKLQTGFMKDESKLSNDELHFILVHQNFELWFKLIINELKCTRDILAAEYVEESNLPQAVHHMRRVIETFRLMSQQWKVMETLEPQEFLNFRDSYDYGRWGMIDDMVMIDGGMPEMAMEDSGMDMDSSPYSFVYMVIN